MNNTKVQIRATNLTREGMEMMFNIRDTNRRKCSWKTDQFWLYLGSGDTAANEEMCDSNKIFQKWVYTIKEWVKNWERVIYAEKLANIDDDYKIEKFYSLDGDWFFKDDSDFNNARNKALVTFTWTYKYLSWGVSVTWSIAELLWEWVEFYRVVRIYGIYNKISNNLITDVSELKNSTPKEMRFCVKTFYKMGVWDHSSELCSIMTNFME